MRPCQRAATRVTQGAVLRWPRSKKGRQQRTLYLAFLHSQWSDYHGKRISHAVVMTDALNIYDGILKLKKMVLQRRAA